jgi:hypothetical protein
LNGTALGRAQIDDKPHVLKGRGFSHAIKSSGINAALAAEGM